MKEEGRATWGGRILAKRTEERRRQQQGSGDRRKHHDMIPYFVCKLKNVIKKRCLFILTPRSGPYSRAHVWPSSRQSPEVAQDITALETVSTYPPILTHYKQTILLLLPHCGDARSIRVFRLDKPQHLLFPNSGNLVVLVISFLFIF